MSADRSWNVWFGFFLLSLKPFFFLFFDQKGNSGKTRCLPSTFWCGWNHSTDHQDFFSNGMLSHLTPKVTLTLSLSFSLSNTHAQMVLPHGLECACVWVRADARVCVCVQRTSWETFKQSATIWWALIAPRGTKT